jgi:GTPase Era involved in 16S rRNA processing
LSKIKKSQKKLFSGKNGSDLESIVIENKAQIDDLKQKSANL